MRSDFYNPNLTFGSIPTTCYRNERPAFFHSGEKPKDTDDRLEAFLRGMVKTVKMINSPLFMTENPLRHTRNG